MKGYGIAMSGDAVNLGLGSMTDARWKAFFDTMSSEKLTIRHCRIPMPTICSS
jgi:hypothetical protein